MQMSRTGRQMLIGLEGFKAHVYHDSKGLPTIGVGHLLTRAELDSGVIVLRDQQRALSWGDGLSRADVDAVLQQDLPDYEEAVERLVIVALQQYQFDALVSFCFNLGESQFSRSTLLKRVNESRFDAVPNEFRKWRFVVLSGGIKKEIKGLVNRRQQEIDCWNGVSAQPEPVQIQQPIEPEPLPVVEQPAVYAPRSPLPRIQPRQYAPNRWLSLVNPLDWFPRWGTYLSIFAALALFVIDAFGYPVNDAIYAVLGAFATARMRRAIDRNPKSIGDNDYEYAGYR